MGGEDVMKLDWILEAALLQACDFCFWVVVESSVVERYLVHPLFRKTRIKKLLISLSLEIVDPFEGRLAICDEYYHRSARLL